MKSFIEWIKTFFKPPEVEKIGLDRRKLIFTGIGGFVGALIFRSQSQAAEHTYNPALIRPPGSVAENEFLSRCIKCGECMKVCPTNAIQPTFLEAGLDGMWTPVLNYKLGYCEYGCTLCTKVCPTEAIKPLTLEAKQKENKLGQAFFDKSRCLPYAFGRSCMVCEEHCPTPEKAIWFEEVEVMPSKGMTETIKLPHVDPEQCIGCGICSNKCPVKDEPAIFVTSVGETRHPDNQMLLSNDFGYGGIY